ncbi:MAG: hypothetical protein KDC39_08090 [Actinobacteria bacterium]|nr:hypothetical protein [Actinomycetota bacterium]
MRFSRRTAVGLGAVALAGLTAVGCSTQSAEGPTAQQDVAASPAPVAQVEDLRGVHTQVMLDSGFVTALESLGLTPGVVGGASLKQGVLSFPITGGDVKYYQPGTVDPFVQGEILHDGSGITLASGDTKVTLEDFDIDPGTSKLFGKVSVNGKVAAESAYLFFLDGTTLQPLATGPNNTAVLEGTTVKISPDAADLLNATFETDAVEPDLVVGIAKITISTK